MINNTYITKKFLGKGGSANVFLVENYAGDYFVAKVIKDKKEYTEEYSRMLIRRESEIMSYLSEHPNILQNYEVLFDSIAEFGNGSKESINCTILELAQNGTLSELTSKIGRMEEFAASFLFNQILSGVSYMHNLDIAHWDIKPHNILLDLHFNVKISDFGVSQIINSKNGMVTSRRGTQGFMAPELEPLHRVDEYNPKSSDIYALGVTLLYITWGQKNSSVNDFIPLNFSKLNLDKKTNSSENGNEVQHHDLDFVLKSLEISDELKDLLSCMLSFDPELRPTAEEIQSHPWVLESTLIDPWTVYKYLSEI